MKKFSIDNRTKNFKKQTNKRHYTNSHKNKFFKTKPEEPK